MGILQNLNSRINYYDKCEHYEKATEDDIKALKDYSDIELPEDYLNFLREIMGVSFVIDDYPTFEFWCVNDILNQRRDFPFIEKSLPKSLVIGTDLGDFLFLYGHGKEGFGLYCVESSCASYENAKKIANSLTEFLVEGTGFDGCFDY